MATKEKKQGKKREVQAQAQNQGFGHESQSPHRVQEQFSEYPQILKDRW
jgi:hypothetical protein